MNGTASNGAYSDRLSDDLALETTETSLLLPALEDMLWLSRVTGDPTSPSTHGPPAALDPCGAGERDEPRS